MSIIELAHECREAAETVLRRHQKLASFDLYRVLAKCMELCDACRSSNTAQDELRGLIAAAAPTGNRVYVEHGSDEFTLCCRYVFHGDTSRANVCRYAHALREARKLGLTPGELFAWLAGNGGVNALYLRRPLTAATASAKVLRLDRSVTFPKNGRFVLVLERGADNVFTVHACDAEGA